MGDGRGPANRSNTFPQQNVNAHGMTKNTIVLVVVAVILGAVYVVYFSDWFQTQSIQIIPTIRPSGGRRVATAPRAKGDAQTYDVTFGFDGSYAFTKIQVFAAEDLQTNKYPAPFWDLISDSKSAPVKYLLYGDPPKGMKPSVPRARALPLQADVEYVLKLEAGKIRAQTNFHTREMTARKTP